MNINKLYCGRALIIKSVSAFLLPIAVQVCAALIHGDDAFVLILALMIVSSLLYSVPFILTISCIRREGIRKIGGLAFKDLMSLMFPSIMSAIIIEVVDLIVNGTNPFAGIFVVLFGILYSLLSLSFWIAYFLNAKMSKIK